MSIDTKGKAIESALSQIEKKFGKGSIMRLGERPQDPDLRLVGRSKRQLRGGRAEMTAQSRRKRIGQFLQRGDRVRVTLVGVAQD